MQSHLVLETDLFLDAPSLASAYQVMNDTNKKLSFCAKVVHTAGIDY